MAIKTENSAGGSDNGIVSIAPTSFAAGFISSDAFRALFKDGMTVVEDAASYLDGKGREQARTLPRMVALAYASESMRLTTRLMQLASWLLLQRAVLEGELTRPQAAKEKHKVNLSVDSEPARDATYHELPADLRDLVSRSARLQDRILRLDGLLNENMGHTVTASFSPVAEQIDRLQTALNR